jgi:hypothetical protein
MRRRVALGSAALTLALAALALASTTRGFQGTVTAVDHQAKTLSWKSLPDSGSAPKSLTATWDEKTQFLQQAKDSFETTPSGPERVKVGSKVYAEAKDAQGTGAWRLNEVRLIH